MENKKFLALILLIGVLTGCNRDTKNTDIVGKYILTRIEKDNTAILEDEIKNCDVTGLSSSMKMAQAHS